MLPVTQQPPHCIPTARFLSVCLSVCCVVSCEKAFVAFKDAVESAKARERIHGRMFAGSMVKVVYISQQEYDAAKAAAPGATTAAAGPPPVGLVSHGSPSPSGSPGGGQAAPPAASDQHMVEDGNRQ